MPERAMVMEANGYKHDFVDEVLDYECMFCLSVLKNPSCLVTCSHSFCRDCLQLWIHKKAMKKESLKCPIDDKLFIEADILPDYTMAEIVNALKVYCDNSAQGCKVIVELQDLKQHLLDCDFHDESKQCEVERVSGNVIVEVTREKEQEKIKRLVKENKELKSANQRLQKDNKKEVNANTSMKREIRVLRDQIITLKNQSLREEYENTILEQNNVISLQDVKIRELTQQLSGAMNIDRPWHRCLTPGCKWCIFWWILAKLYRLMKHQYEVRIMRTRNVVNEFLIIFLLLCYCYIFYTSVNEKVMWFCQPVVVATTVGAEHAILNQPTGN